MGDAAISGMLSLQAILLAGLALKRRWAEKRKAEGVTEVVKPNIVCSTAVHVRAHASTQCFCSRHAETVDEPPCIVLPSW